MNTAKNKIDPDARADWSRLKLQAQREKVITEFLWDVRCTDELRRRFAKFTTDKRRARYARGTIRRWKEEAKKRRPKQ